MLALTHVLVGLANPHLKCAECKVKVRYWHNPDRCGHDCTRGFFNHPCEHAADTISSCPTWSPGAECICEEPCN
jgi:hypothetical protein